MFEQLKGLYESLDDEQSKVIFMSRLRCALNENVSEIESMVNDIVQFQQRHECEELTEWITRPTSLPVVLFGAGGGALNIYQKLPQKHQSCVFCCCDNNATLYGSSISLEDKIVPVISPAQLVKDYFNSTIVISTPEYKDEVYAQLLELGFNKSQIVYPWYGKQYFESFLTHSDSEIFIDAGCFNLNSSYKFIQWANDNYEKIYAFEPDAALYEKCVAKNNNPKIQMVNKGLWSKAETLSFASDDIGGCHIDTNGESKIETISLDKFLEGKPVTLIKMDIEGAELEALNGAAETIRKYKPKLAICIYHKPEDIIDIPLMIKKLNPDYKFYIRHYWIDASETVIYAI